MKVNGLSEFFALPGEILSEESLDRIVGGKRSSGHRRGPRTSGKGKKRPGMKRGPVGTRID